MGAKFVNHKKSQEKKFRKSIHLSCDSQFVNAIIRELIRQRRDSESLIQSQPTAILASIEAPKCLFPTESISDACALAAKNGTNKTLTNCT